MTQQQTQPEQSEDDTGLTSAGERLRVAREAKNLSVHDVAHNLKIDVDKIEEIERGDVSGLGAQVFITGYLRAYARLLELPADEITQQFVLAANITQPTFDPASSPATQNFGKMHRSSSEPAVGSDSSWLHPGMVLIVIVMLLVGGYFAWNQFNAFELVAELEGDNSSEPLAIAAPRLESGSIVDAFTIEGASGESENTDAAADSGSSGFSTASSSFEKNNPVDAIVADKSSDSNATAGVSVQDPLPQTSAMERTPTDTVQSMTSEDVADSTASPATTETLAETSTLESEATSVAVSGAGSIDIASPSLASATQEEITLFLSDESWVEVTDARGEQLVYRLGKAGEVISLEGIEPFNVMLGYVPAVRIMINGEAYDLSAYAGRRSARFQLHIPAEG